MNYTLFLSSFDWVFKRHRQCKNPVTAVRWLSENKVFSQSVTVCTFIIIVIIITKRDIFFCARGGQPMAARGGTAHKCPTLPSYIIRRGASNATAYWRWCDAGPPSWSGDPSVIRLTGAMNGQLILLITQPHWIPLISTRFFVIRVDDKGHMVWRVLLFIVGLTVIEYCYAISDQTSEIKIGNIIPEKGEKTGQLFLSWRNNIWLGYLYISYINNVWIH